MRAKALAIISLIVLALSSSACITDVCRINSGQVEIKVVFTGFDLNDAETLEVDSTIRGPEPAPGRFEYYDRRIDSMRFPEAARAGSESFILDPGAYINQLHDVDAQFSWIVVMRVRDANGLLLAEGRFELKDVKTNGCFLARKMTVSTAQTCNEKDEGDPCVSASANPWVCQGSGSSMSCEESTCGDGFIDRRHGELCDPAAPVGDTACHATTCLPTPVEVTLTDGKVQWNELAMDTPPARANAAFAKFSLGGSEGVVMFGGVDDDVWVGSAFVGTYLSDTWIFDGVDWVVVNVVGDVPSARADSAMAWDPVEQHIVMYGGRGDAGRLHETWIFDPATGVWTEYFPIRDDAGQTLTELHGAAMAFDSGRDQMVLYGGSDDNTPIANANWWTYSHTDQQWSLETTSTDLRFDHTMVDIPSLGGLMVFGGQGGVLASADVYRDALFYNGSQVTVPSSQMGGVDRTRHGAVYSDALGELVFYGGHNKATVVDANGTLLRTTFGCTPSATDMTCTDRSAPDAPHGRRGHIMFEVDSTIYVYGGVVAVTNGEDVDSETTVDDMWQLTMPADPKSSFALSQGLRGSKADESLVTGLYDLISADATTLTAVDRAGPMLIADLDGDGRDELALGLPGSACTDTTKTCGRVLIKDHPVVDQVMGETSAALATFRGEEDETRRGTWVGTSIAAGDINGDGAKDLVFGAPRARVGGGALYVVLGGDDHNLSFAPPTSYTLQIGATADYNKYHAFNPPSPEGGPLPYHLGYSVAVGDFDGDGYADVVASAPSEGQDATTLSSVYVLAGPESSWPTGSGPQRFDSWATLTITTDTPQLQLGYSLTTGDLDGDGFTDLIIGTAPRPPFTTAVDSPLYGAVAVIFGGEGFFDRPNPVVIVEQLDPADGVLIAAPDGSDLLAGLGGVVVATDLDGDGADELAVSLGRPSRATRDPGAVALFPGAGFVTFRETGGTEQSLREQSTVLRGPANSGFGATLTAGDANGDRNMDLIIGAPYQDGPAAAGFVPRPETGAIYTVLGSSRADYFAAAEVTVDELKAVDVAGGDDVTIPLIIVRGNENFGFFGNSSVTSSHIVTQEVESPAGYTLVYQPGWFNGEKPGERNRGRIWTLFLAGLLGCESWAPCPNP